MKVKIKKWHGVAIWKWEIDEDVSWKFVSKCVPLITQVAGFDLIFLGLWNLQNAV